MLLTGPCDAYPSLRFTQIQVIRRCAHVELYAQVVRSLSSRICRASPYPRRTSRGMCLAPAMRPRQIGAPHEHSKGAAMSHSVEGWKNVNSSPGCTSTSTSILRVSRSWTMFGRHEWGQSRRRPGTVSACWSAATCTVCRPRGAGAGRRLAAAALVEVVFRDRVGLGSLEGPVGDAEMKVVVGIEPRAKPVQEAHGAEGGRSWSRGAGLVERGVEGCPIPVPLRGVWGVSFLRLPRDGKKILALSFQTLYSFMSQEIIEAGGAPFQATRHPA